MAGQRPTMIVGLKSFLKQQYLQCTHRVVTLVNKGIQELSVITQHYKGLPQQAEVAQGVPGRLRPRIFLTLGTTRVVGRQSYAPAAFTPEEIPGTHF